MKTFACVIASICLTGTTIAAPVRASASGCSAQPLACGTSATVSLSSSSGCVIDTFPTAVFEFNGTSGETVSLFATDPAGYDLFVTLSDPSGNQIATSFLDEPASLDRALTTSGTYTVAVNFGNPHDVGPFTLTLTCSNPTGSDGKCHYTATIAVPGSVSDALTAADAVCAGGSHAYAKAWAVAATAGEALHVVYSATFPPYMEIDGPDASGAFRRGDAAGEIETDYVAPTSGTVTIYTSSNTATGATGNFTLTVTPADLPPCRSRASRH